MKRQATYMNMDFKEHFTMLKNKNVLLHSSETHEGCPLYKSKTVKLRKENPMVYYQKEDSFRILCEST